jgi:DNA ligase-1
MHNGNEATTNALGRTERSSHKANLVPVGTLGALVCSSPKWAGTFNLGTGFTDALRAEIWANRDSWRGATVRFKYQSIGTKDLPRIPVFQGRRDTRDL